MRSIVWRNNILNLSSQNLLLSLLLLSIAIYLWVSIIIFNLVPNWCANDMTMQDVDGCHLLPGAPETSCPSTQRDYSHLICILPLQSHHGEAADAAECGPGRGFLVKWRIDIDPIIAVHWRAPGLPHCLPHQNSGNCLPQRNVLYWSHLWSPRRQALHQGGSEIQTIRSPAICSKFYK